MHRHILIEAVSPCVDGGRFATKGVAGEPRVVEADIFRDGHSQIRAVVRWQKKGAGSLPRLIDVSIAIGFNVKRGAVVA